MPTVKSIAKDIARRDKARIKPTGLYTINMLGLFTLVPLKAVYLTDGTLRKLEIGGRILIFKKRDYKSLST